MVSSRKSPFPWICWAGNLVIHTVVMQGHFFPSSSIWVGWGGSSFAFEAFRSQRGGAGAVCKCQWCRQEDCWHPAETFQSSTGLSHSQTVCHILSRPCSCCIGGCLHTLPSIHKVSSCLLTLSWSDLRSPTYNFSIFWNKIELDFCCVFLGPPPKKW